MIKINKIHLMQKQFVRIVFHEDFRWKENFVRESQKTIIKKTQCLKHFLDKYLSTCNLYA